MKYTHTLKLKKHGQILVVFALTWALFLAGLVVVYNTGVLVGERIRIQQVADNVSFSGAVWEARALNYIAYCNRAIIADLSFIAFLNSAVTNLNAYAELLDNLGTVASFIPYIGAAINTALGVIADIVEMIADMAKEVKDSNAWEDAVMASLYYVQQPMLLFTQLSLPFLMNEILKDNDEGMSSYSINGISDVADLITQASLIKANFENFDSLFYDAKGEGDALRYMTEKTISAWTRATDNGNVPVANRDWWFSVFLAGIGVDGTTQILNDKIYSADYGYSRFRYWNPAGIFSDGGWEWTGRIPLTSLHEEERPIDWDDIGFFRYDRDGLERAGVYSFVKKPHDVMNDFIFKNFFSDGEDGLFGVPKKDLKAYSKSVVRYLDPEINSARHANLSPGREPNLFNPFWYAELVPLNHDFSGLTPGEDVNPGEVETFLSAGLGMTKDVWQELIAH